MTFQTNLIPLATTQVVVYPLMASTFSPAILERPVFGMNTQLTDLNRLFDSSVAQYRRPQERWHVYDEKHLFAPQSGRSLSVGDQHVDLRSLLAGKRYGQEVRGKLLPDILMTRPMPVLEKMRAHIIEFYGKKYILESISPAHEFIFRRVERPNWSGFGEDYLIVFKKEGEWVAECQSVPTQPAGMYVVGEGAEDAIFQFRVIPNSSEFWMTKEQAVPVYTTNPIASELPSVREVEEALRIMPPLLLGGLQSVELIDRQHENNYCGQMDPKGILRLFRGSRDKHPHAILFHELGHWFAMRFLGSVFLAGQAHWLRAMMQDARNPSEYATTTIGEDFAESVALYFLTGGGKFGNAAIHFQNRFKILDAWMHDCLKSPFDIAPDARLLIGGDRFSGEQIFNRAP